MIETIHILHTNDIHSHFEYWPQIHRFLQTKRQEFEEKVNPFLFLILATMSTDRTRLRKGRQGKEISNY